MRKKFVQIAALLLVFSLIVPAAMAAVGSPGQPETILRVGLAYGSDAMEGANLANEVGSGYLFGYYDSGNRFVELGVTDASSISMVKTVPVGYSASAGYASYQSAFASAGNVVVGCYHAQLPDPCASFAEASAAAAIRADGFVAYIDGAYYARFGNFAQRSDAEYFVEQLNQSGLGAELCATSAYGVSAVATGTNTILFQYDDKGAGTGLGVQPRPAGDPKTVTWFRGNKYYGGFRYERVSGGDLTVVNMVELEDYVKGVIPYEMSGSWPVEALKAQALCARSYAMSNLNSHSSYHFDLCTTTSCQVYYGRGNASRYPTETSDRAVDETAGEYVLYEGKIAETVFYSSNGGATENSENVWTSAIPYLRGKADPYEALVESKIPSYRWSAAYTGKELQTWLNNKGYTSCAEVADVKIVQTPTGNVYSVTFTDVNGKSFTFSKEKARTELSSLGVRSMRYTVNGGSGVGGTVGGGYAVADGSALDSMNGAWVLDGSGNLVQMNTGTVYAITGSGVQEVAPAASSGGLAGLGGGVTAPAGSFVFSGAGYGHNIGMSQWGAYAMAQAGYTYRDILTFYYTGVEIGAL